MGVHHRRSPRDRLSHRLLHGGTGLQPDPAQPQSLPHGKGAGRGPRQRRVRLRRRGGAERSGSREKDAGGDRRPRRAGGYRPEQCRAPDRLPDGLPEHPCGGLRGQFPREHHRAGHDLLPFPARDDRPGHRPDPEHHQRHLPGRLPGRLFRQQGGAGQDHDRPGIKSKRDRCDDQSHRSRLVQDRPWRAAGAERAGERHSRHRRRRIRGRPPFRALPRCAGLRGHEP